MGGGARHRTVGAVARRREAAENSRRYADRAAVPAARTRSATGLRHPRRSLCADQHSRSEKINRTRARTLDAISAIARWLSGALLVRLRLMKISLGTDHAGYRLKEKVKQLLESLGHQ